MQPDHTGLQNDLREMNMPYDDKLHVEAYDNSLSYYMTERHLLNLKQHINLNDVNLLSSGEIDLLMQNLLR